MTRVVVGVDGSRDAASALRRAVHEARLRGADLDVVHVVAAPSVLADPVLFPPPSRQELHARGLEVIDETLAGTDVGGLEIERIAMIGHAARVLCDVAKGAELLVVGARGLGGFRGLLVGSVTHQVVAHAPCPVLVVVPEGRPVAQEPPLA